MTRRAMPAYRLSQPGRAPEFVEVPVPDPGPGEVLIKMGGAGLCRSDLEVIDEETPLLPVSWPVTLGHENAGWVVASGPSVDPAWLDQAVVVSTIRFCGRCPFCRSGRENYCPDLTARGIVEDGGLAPFMVADARQLARLRTLAPPAAAPLSDAGLTAYHAVALALRDLPEESAVMVIGVGGLGSFAVQFLRRRSVTVVAVDSVEDRCRVAGDLGAACALVAGPATHAEILEVTGGAGVHAVVDCVGSDQTLALAARLTRVGGAIVVVGREGGTLPFSIATVRAGVRVVKSRGGTMAELEAVVRLAEQGSLRIDVEEFAFARVAEAYDRLRRGTLAGRAVVTYAP